jgi:thiol-disulfide isomerase/thioredoxin
MRRPLMTLALLAAVSLTSRAGDTPPATQQSDGSFAALKQSFEEATRTYSALRKAAYPAAKKKGDEVAKAFKFGEPAPGPEFSPRFLAIAQNNPKGPDSFEALRLALQTSTDEDGNALATRVAALKVLRKHHVSSPALNKRFLSLLAWFPEKEARQFLDDVIAHNPDRDIQARAVQALANSFERRAELAHLLATDVEYRARVEKSQGTAEVARRIAEADVNRSEAEKSRAVLRDRYADLIPDLSIGQPAPPLVGEALDGKRAALAELKGNVVVIDVWTTWCGPCKAMIPHERAMVERLKGKHFKLVSISADEKKETVKEFLATEPMPWTHWWSGPEGKIIELLNIQHYPTIYVLDTNGVIRYTEIRGEELEKAVNVLLMEAETRSDAEKHALQRRR